MMSGGIHEPEIDRLQKQSDVFTKKYEHERKQILALKEKLDNTMREKSNIEKDVYAERLSLDKTKRDQKIRTLENELEKEVTKYDQVLSRNQGTKWEIDVMRKEINTSAKVLDGLGKDLGKTSDKI